MPRNIFIVGLPKSGKTTLLQKLINELKKRGKKVGGFISPAIIEHGTRTGFYVQNTETGKTAQLASLSSGGPKVSKYSVKVKEFESIALPTMNKIDRYDVFVLDEIGRMEMKSKKFTDTLDKVFESETPVIASIADEYAPVYGFQGEVILLTPTNREGVYMRLLQHALETTSLKTFKKAEVVAADVPRRRARILGKKSKRRVGKKPKMKKKEKVSKAEAEEKTLPAVAGERKGLLKKIKELIGF